MLYWNNSKFSNLRVKLHVLNITVNLLCGWLRQQILQHFKGKKDDSHNQSQIHQGRQTAISEASAQSSITLVHTGQSINWPVSLSKKMNKKQQKQTPLQHGGPFKLPAPHSSLQQLLNTNCCYWWSCWHSLNHGSFNSFNQQIAMVLWISMGFSVCMFNMSKQYVCSLLLLGELTVLPLSVQHAAWIHVQRKKPSLYNTNNCVTVWATKGSVCMTVNIRPHLVSTFNQVFYQWQAGNQQEVRERDVCVVSGIHNLI